MQLSRGIRISSTVHASQQHGTRKSVKFVHKSRCRASWCRSRGCRSRIQHKNLGLQFAEEAFESLNRVSKQQQQQQQQRQQQHEQLQHNCQQQHQQQEPLT
jgi:hypothetical protein